MVVDSDGQQDYRNLVDLGRGRPTDHQFRLGPEKGNFDFTWLVADLVHQVADRSHKKEKVYIHRT